MLIRADITNEPDNESQAWANAIKETFSYKQYHLFFILLSNKKHILIQTSVDTFCKKPTLPLIVIISHVLLFCFSTTLFSDSFPILAIMTCSVFSSLSISISISSTPSSSLISLDDLFPRTLRDIHPRRKSHPRDEVTLALNWRIFKQSYHQVWKWL